MAITTNAELITALDGATGYLHRTDLTAKIPDFIRLCESKVNRKLALLLQETEATLTATVGSRLMAVPTRFGTPIALWLTTYLPRIELLYRLPQDMPVTSDNGQSDYYTIDGSDVATENPADQAYTYTFRYLSKFDIATTSTNTVLTNYPDIYIYGTLLASTSYTRDLSMVQMWQGMYDEGIREAMRDTQRTKSKQALRTEFNAPRSNILRGE